MLKKPISYWTAYVKERIFGRFFIRRKGSEIYEPPMEMEAKNAKETGSENNVFSQIIDMMNAATKTLNETSKELEAVAEKYSETRKKLREIDQRFKENLRSAGKDYRIGMWFDTQEQWLDSHSTFLDRPLNGCPFMEYAEKFTN